MAVAPSPRARVRASQPAPSPPPRARRVPPEEHQLYEAYDGPPRLEPIRVEGTSELRQPSRSLAERVDFLADKSPAEAKALLLASLWQFILAKTPFDTICERMQISANTQDALRRELYRKQREDVRAKDPFDYIAPLLAEMEEVKATAWREVAIAKAPEWSRRMSALNTIMKAHSEVGKILQIAGLFDNSPMRAPLADDEEDSGGANVLKEMSRRFLEGGYQANHIIHDAG